MNPILSFEDGKYKVYQNGVALTVTRYDEPWRDLTGDKFMGLLIDELVSLHQPIASDVVAAWIAEYVDNHGNYAVYVSTHQDLADENDRSGKAKPLYLAVAASPSDTSQGVSEADAFAALAAHPRWHLDCDILKFGVAGKWRVWIEKKRDYSVKVLGEGDTPIEALRAALRSEPTGDKTK